MEVAELTATLDAHIAPLARNLEAADVYIGRARNHLKELERRAELTGVALGKVEIPARNAIQTAAVLETMQRSMSKTSRVAIETADHLHNVKMTARQAAEDTAVTEVLIRNQNRIQRQIRETNRERKEGFLAAGGSGLAEQLGALVPGGRHATGYGLAVGIGSVSSLVAPLLPAVGVIAAIPGLVAPAVASLGVLALSGFGGVAKAIEGDKNAYKSLLPAQKQFVDTIRELMPLLNGMKQIVGENLFGPMSRAFKDVATNSRALGQLGGILAGMARLIGQIAASWIRFLGSTSFLTAFNRTLAAVAPMWITINHAIQNVVQGLVNMGTTFAPLEQYLTGIIAKFGEWFREWSKSSAAKEANQGIIDSLKLLGQTVSAVADLLEGLFEVLAPIGKYLLSVLNPAMHGLAGFLRDNSAEISGALIAAVRGLMRVLQALQPIFRDAFAVGLSVAKLVGPALNALAVVINRLQKPIEAVLVAFAAWKVMEVGGAIFNAIKGGLLAMSATVVEQDAIIIGANEAAGSSFLALLGPIAVVAAAAAGLYSVLSDIWAGSPSGTKDIGATDLGKGLSYNPRTGLITFQDTIVNSKKAADMLGLSLDQLKAKLKDLDSAAAAMHNPLRKSADPSAVYGPPYDPTAAAQADWLKQFGSIKIPSVGSAPAWSTPGSGGGGGSTKKLPAKTAPPATQQEQELLNFAKMLIGTPYVYGAMSKAGIDCSGLVAWAYGKMGIGLPHSTYAQVQMGRQVLSSAKGSISKADIAKLRPGDVIFTNYGEGGKSGPGHEGLYVGHGMVEAADHTGTRVRYDPLSQFISGGQYSVRRYLTGGGTGTAAGVGPLPPDVLAALAGAQAGVKGAKGIDQQIAAEREYIAELHKAQQILNSEHATQQALVRLNKEKATIARELAAAEKSLHSMQVEQRAQGQLRQLLPYTGGASAPQISLKRLFDQVEKQMKTSGVQIGAKAKQEMETIAHLMEQGLANSKVTAVVRQLLTNLRNEITSRAAAIKSAASNVASAVNSMGQNILSAFDAIQSQWQSPAAKKLQQMQAEDSLKSAQDAYKQAVDQYGADSPEAQAAARALTEAQLAAQAQADQEAHDKKVKADKDALEKRLYALEQEAKGAKTKAAAERIQKAINDLLAEYGITPDAVQGAMDWNASQTLFVQSLGDLKASIDALTKALGGTVGGSTPPGFQPVGKASGGIFDAVPGGIYRIAEAGHPEAVIPLDPAKRNRAAELLGRVHRVLGFANGGLPGLGANSEFLGDEAYAEALRKRHGPWLNKRRWPNDLLRTANVYKSMLEKRYGSSIHFEDAWPQALYKVQRAALDQAMVWPPNSVSDLTWGQVWYDFPGGAWSLALKGGLTGVSGAGSGYGGPSGGMGTPPTGSGGGQNWALEGKIPRYGRGGLIKARPGGTLVLAGEAGQDEAIGPVGHGFGGTIHLTVENHHYLDGQQITDVVTERQIRNARFRRPGITGGQ